MQLSASWDGHLPCLESLTPGAAASLAASRKWNGLLPGVTAFETADSVAVAAALATRRGRLSLPNLERISPRTLAALIVKKDVEIPPVEKLVLIPEPDGAANDDFIVPEAR